MLDLMFQVILLDCFIRKQQVSEILSCVLIFLMHLSVAL